MGDGSLDDIGCYLEWLCQCEQAFLLRAGPGAIDFGDDFLWAAAGSVKPGTKIAVIKGLTASVAPRWLRWVFPSRPFTAEYMRAAFRCLRRYGLTPIWDRKQKHRLDLNFIPREPNGRIKNGLG